jgi:hypothetical protein
MVRVPFRARYATSRAIFGQAWRLMRTQRDLWVFPILGLVAMLVAVVPLLLLAFFRSGGWLRPAVHVLGPWAPLAVFVVLPLFYPFAVLASLFNAALCFAAHERMEGRPGGKREAWRRALAQLGPIARFNLVAMLVSGALAFVGQLLDKLRLVPYLGQAFQALGAFAWATASYFVIPVLVVEGERSALGALRSSVAVARTQWGKATAGVVTIGLVLMVPMLVATFAVLMPLTMLLPLWLHGLSFLVATGVLVGTFLVLMMTMAMLAGAMGVLYQTALYRYARTGKVAGPFTGATLVDAWAPYRDH